MSVIVPSTIESDMTRKKAHLETKTQNRVVIRKKTRSAVGLPPLSAHIASITSSTSQNNRFSYFIQFLDRKFLKRIASYAGNNGIQICTSTPKTVLFLTPSIETYTTYNSLYFRNHPPFVAWANISTITNTQFPTVVSNFFENNYHQIDENFDVRPVDAKFSDIFSNITRTKVEVPNGMTFFHFFGFGLSISGKYLRISKQNIKEAFSIPVKNIFRALGSSSFCVFDCDTAGYAAECIGNLVKKGLDQSSKQKKPSFVPIKNTNSIFEDCFCLCATSYNENLPNNPLLPRDFLTSVLLTPIPLSILCHVLQYYRTTYDQPGFPFTHLKTLLAFERPEEIAHIERALTVVIESIASDFLSTDQFNSLLRAKRHITIMFQRFILAQFLLEPYSVHPISYPPIPSMSRHPMWAQWKTTLDLWISSHAAPSPSFNKDFFIRIIRSFISSLSEDFESNVHKTTLSAAAGLLSDQFSDTLGLSLPLAYYASKSESNRMRLIPLLRFGVIIRLVLQADLSVDVYHSLLYLSICCFQPIYGCSLLVDSLLDSTKLLRNLSSDSYNDNTKTLMSAVLASLCSQFPPIRKVCRSEKFLVLFSRLLFQANTEFLFWLMVLLKKAYDTDSINEKMLSNMLIHVQIASSCCHKSSECRTAAISCISSFMQSTWSSFNSSLFLFCIPCFFDMSFLVRNQLLFLVIRSISSLQQMKPKLSENITPYSTLSMVFSAWFGSKEHFSKYLYDIQRFCNEVEEYTNKNDSLDRIYSVLCYLLEYFCYDPHPVVQKSAIRAKELFRSRLSSGGSFSRIAHPFDSNINSDNESLPKKTVSFGSDSLVMFSLASDQLINQGIWKPDIEYKVYHHDFEIQEIDPQKYSFLPTHIVQRQSRIMSGDRFGKLSYCPISSNLYAATNSKMVCRISSNMCTTTRIQVGEFEISDLNTMSYQNNSYAIVSTVDGCVHLWNPELEDSLISFRASQNFLSQSAAQLSAPLNRSPKIATARGNSGIVLWDVPHQKSIGEWSSTDSYGVSALSIHGNDDNVCISGLANGSLSITDFRMPQDSQIKWIKGITIGDKVVKISGFHAQPNTCYYATSSGSITMWDDRSEQIKTITQRRGPLISFDAHPGFPMLIFCSANESPVILSPGGQLLQKIASLSPASIVCTHKTEKYLAFAQQNSEITSFQLEKNSQY